MADNSGVGEVPDSGQVTLGHLDGDGQELVQDGHAVGDVDDLLVAYDLGDEVAWVLQVRGDRHAHPERTHVVELLQQILHLDRQK